MSTQKPPAMDKESAGVDRPTSSHTPPADLRKRAASVFLVTAFNWMASQTAFGHVPSLAPKIRFGEDIVAVLLQILIAAISLLGYRLLLGSITAGDIGFIAPQLCGPVALWKLGTRSAA